VIQEFLSSQQEAYLEASHGSGLFTDLTEDLHLIAAEHDLKVLGSAGEGATSVALLVQSPVRGKTVLKFEGDHSRAVAQSRCLTAWAENGIAPHVHATYAAYGAYLMDWVPGRLSEVEHHDLVVDTLYQAWTASVPEDGYVDKWGRILTVTRQRLEAVNDPLLPVEFADKVEQLYADLKDVGPKGLCHGDPCPRNTLVHQDHCWLIDPEPYHGTLASMITQWAVRAGRPYGNDAVKHAVTAMSRLGYETDADVLLAWVQLHSITYAAYTRFFDRPLPSPVLRLLPV
jgi:hypothetical protein